MLKKIFQKKVEGDIAPMQQQVTKFLFWGVPILQRRTVLLGAVPINSDFSGGGAI